MAACLTRAVRYSCQGAMDGVYCSNTFMYERCFNWTDTLIEANPTNFNKLAQNVARGIRPRAAAVHSAVCADGIGSIEVTRKGGVRDGGCDGGDVGCVQGAIFEASEARWPSYHDKYNSGQRAQGQGAMPPVAGDHGGDGPAWQCDAPLARCRRCGSDGT